LTRIYKYLILAGISLAMAFSGVLALAHDTGGMTDSGAMMGRAGHSETMGGGMEGCMQMMQGMHGGGSHRPNEQWRQRQY